MAPQKNTVQTTPSKFDIINYINSMSGEDVNFIHRETNKKRVPERLKDVCPSKWSGATCRTEFAGHRRLKFNEPRLGETVLQIILFDGVVYRPHLVEVVLTSLIVDRSVTDYLDYYAIEPIAN